MRNLFRTFNSLLFPPPSPPTTSITADDFATILTVKTKTIRSQFSPPHTQDLQPTTSTAQTPSSPSVPSLRRKYPNFSSPAILQHVLLIQSPHTFSKQSLPHSYQHSTHIINTSLLRGIFPTAFKVQGFFISSFKQARVTPLLKKPTLNTSLLENYRPVSLLPFIAKTLERVVFNQVEDNSQNVHRTSNWTLNSQVSGVAIQLRLRYSQSLKPCKLQKPIPNHQSSFCWICLPLLTLSIIRSSCPPSHHWTSLGFHFAGFNPISLIGFSGWPWEGRYPQHIN